MHSVNIHEARTHLLRLVHQAAKGEPGSAFLGLTPPSTSRESPTARSFRAFQDQHFAVKELAPNAWQVVS
jgi:hypothetical protein